MAILKDAWQLYNSLTLCDDSKKGVRTELRRWELHLSHLEQREISSIKKLDLARLRCHLEKKNCFFVRKMENPLHRLGLRFAEQSNYVNSMKI